MLAQHARIQRWDRGVVRLHKAKEKTGRGEMPWVFVFTGEAPTHGRVGAICHDRGRTQRIRRGGKDRK